MGVSTESNIISIPPINKTIRLVVYSLIIMLALISPISPVSSQPIINGGFENGTFGWSPGPYGFTPLFSPGYESSTCVRFMQINDYGYIRIFSQTFQVSGSGRLSFNGLIKSKCGLYLMYHQNIGSQTIDRLMFDSYDYGMSNDWRTFVSQELGPGNYTVCIYVLPGNCVGYFDNIHVVYTPVESVADIDVIVSPIGEPTYVVRIKPGNDYDPDDHFFFYGVERPGWHPPLAPFTDHIINLGSGSFIASRVDSTGYYQTAMSTFSPLPNGVYTVGIGYGPDYYNLTAVGSKTFTVSLGGTSGGNGNTSTGSGFLNTSGLLTPFVINSNLTNTGSYTGNNTAIQTYYSFVYNLINGLNVKIMNFISWLISPIMKFSSYIVVGTSLFSDHVSHMLVFLEPLGIMILALVNALPGIYISVGVFVLCCLLLMVVMGVQ